jgi:hypothetical protein
LSDLILRGLSIGDDQSGAVPLIDEGVHTEVAAVGAWHVQRRRHGVVHSEHALADYEDRP